jgi:tetratricopeptide (TPR) repeat protein
MKKLGLVISLEVFVFSLILPPFSEAGDDLVEKVLEAKAELKSGVNVFDDAIMKNAKDKFLNLLVKEQAKKGYLHYYVALCDYRLAIYYMTENQMDEAEVHTMESQKHLEQAMELMPSWGEPAALYASMLGFEIAFDWSKAMTLGMKSNEYLGKALDLEPGNPRILYIKGSSELFTPEAYGGGADKAIETFKKAVDLFEKERVEDPLKPSWGKEEAFTFLGMAYEQTGEKKKAEEFYRKALDVNPEFGLAKENLEKLKK